MTTNILGSNVVMLHNIKKEIYETKPTTTIDDVKHESGYQLSIIKDETNSKVEESNADWKNYSCKICQKKFTFRSGLRRHMRIHTGETPHPCPKCDKQFGLKYTLQTHLKIHEKDRVKWACNICNKEYMEKQSLLRHMKIHTCEKLYKCAVCDKKYLLSIQLKGHLRSKSHALETMTCNICNTKYSNKSSLLFHMKIHASENPFKCFECDKKFFHRVQLEEHLKSKSHAQQKKVNELEINKETNTYNCKICHKEYKYKYSLTYHMRRHTGGNLQCSICCNTYPNSLSLNLHMKTHEKNTIKAKIISIKSHRSTDLNDQTTLKYPIYPDPLARLPSLMVSLKRFDLQKFSNNSPEQITRHTQDDSKGEVRSDSNNIKIEKIDLDEKTIPEYINLDKYKPNIEEIPSSYLPYNSCVGETICKEEVIISDENM